MSQLTHARSFTRRSLKSSGHRCSCTCSQCPSINKGDGGRLAALSADVCAWMGDCVNFFRKSSVAPMTLTSAKTYSSAPRHAMSFRTVTHYFIPPYHVIKYNPPSHTMTYYIITMYFIFQFDISVHSNTLCKSLFFITRARALAHTQYE